MSSAAFAMAMVAWPVVVLAQGPAGASEAEAAQKELQQYAATLSDRNANQQQRDRDAQRLVSRSSPAADAILMRVLRDNGNREGQVAVAKALASDTTPNPDFIEPLSWLLGDRELTGPAAQALAVFRDNNDARLRLLQFVTNRSQQVNPRRDAIRAMGKLVDKRAAGTLMDLAQRENEDPLVRNAAMDALADMTGLSKYGRDLQQWSSWWKESGGKPEVDWFRDLLNRSVDRAADWHKRLLLLREQEVKFIREEYQDQRISEVDRRKRILAHLQSEADDERWAAVRVVYEEVTQVGPGKATPEMRQALRTMVGDSSTEVRGQVARLLGKINDKNDVDALLTQLTQEKDPDVRRDIVEALGPIQDLRTIAPLLARLNDESFSVARSAAEALKEKADILRKPENREAFDLVAQQLAQRLRGTSGDISLASLRQSVIEAMAALGHPSFLGTFYGLLAPEKETINVRRAALQGLGLIGNPDSADRITRMLDDPNAGVRLDAVKAMRNTASFAHVELLIRRLSPQVEPDSAVRAWAWTVLAGDDGDAKRSLFEKGGARELINVANLHFQIQADSSAVDLDRRAAVYRIAERMLVKAGANADQATLAFVRQNLGETLLRLAAIDRTEETAMQRAAEAATKLDQAYEYHFDQKTAGSTIDLLVQQTTEAYLRAHKYTDAARYMTAVIQGNRIPTTEPLWWKIRGEIERLEGASDYKSAMAMIQAVKAVPLDAQSARSLQMLETKVQKLLNSGGLRWVMPGLAAGGPPERTWA